MKDWKYNGEVIDSIEKIKSIEPDAFGFVYQITLYDKKTKEVKHQYIGKKNIYSTTSKTATKKQLSEFPKSHFRRKKMKDGSLKYYLKNTCESDWKIYHSSNVFIKSNLKNFDITREILMFADTDSELSWKEAKEIICTGALESDTFLNNNVQIKRIIKSKF